jgi:hypothetical protein
MKTAAAESDDEFEKINSEIHLQNDILDNSSVIRKRCSLLY